MANYAFETITAAQAQLILVSDTLTIGDGAQPVTSTSVTVIYESSGLIDIVVGARTVAFGAPLTAVSAQGGLIFSDGSQLYIGDGGSNAFTGGAGTITAAFGGAGDDALSVSGAHDLLQGNAGSDTLTGAAGDDTIYGGQDNDQINPGGGINFVNGNKGSDTITGAGAADTLLGGQGDDHVSGAGFLDGNLGDDLVSGSGQLFGEAGADTLTSIGAGHDTLAGGDGDDSIVAGSGADSITGDDGNDTISIMGGPQVVAGGAGGDKFIFGTGTTSPGTVPQIIDWNGAEDKLSFLGYTPNPSDFTATSASDFATAVTLANSLTTQNHFSFVGVQVGADFIIFAGGSGGVTSVVDLVGRSLADFHTAQNLV